MAIAMSNKTFLVRSGLHRVTSNSTSFKSQASEAMPDLAGTCNVCIDARTVV